MDTSETYIKMCKAFYESLTLKEQLDVVGFAQINFDCIKATKEGQWWCYGESLGVCVPLFSQDQLQEMVGQPNDEIDKYGNVFHHFVEEVADMDFQGYIFGLNKEYEYCKTWEQLWLAFVMSERHQKIWSGTEWIKKT